MSKFLIICGLLLVAIVVVAGDHSLVNAQTDNTVSSTSTATTSDNSISSESTISSTSSESTVVSEISSSEVIESTYSPVSQVPIEVIDLKKIYPPRNVTAELIFDEENNTYSIELVWEKSKTEGVEKYIVMRSEGNRLKFSEVAELDANDTKYIDKDFKIDTTYYYTIQSIKGEEKSKDSNEAVVQITKETQLEAQQVQREAKDNFWQIFLIVNVLIWSLIFLGFLLFKLIQRVRKKRQLSQTELQQNPVLNKKNDNKPVKSRFPNLQ